MRKVIIHILGLLKVKTIDNILFETEIKKKNILETSEGRHITIIHQLLFSFLPFKVVKKEWSWHWLSPPKTKSARSFDVLHRLDQVRRRGWRTPNMKNLQQFPELRPSGVKAGDWIEFGNPALCWRVKAFRFSSHFKENFLLLQFSGKFFFQCLKARSDCYMNIRQWKYKKPVLLLTVWYNILTKWTNKQLPPPSSLFVTSSSFFFFF